MTVAGATPGYSWNLKHTPENVYDNLSRALWASTNKKSRKAAYVIAAPWCSVTRAFYETVQRQSPDCDFRFVWQNDRSEHQTKIIFSTYFQEGDNQLVPYENDVPRADGVEESQLNLTAGINEATVSAIGPHVRPFLSGGGGSSSKFGWGYPTIVYKAQGNVKAATGLPTDLTGLVASIDGGLDRSSPTPELLAAVKDPLPLYKTKEGNRFAQRDKVLLYAGPSTNAPVVEELSKGHGFPAYAETEYAGQQWLALKAFRDPWPLLWGQMEYF